MRILLVATNRHDRLNSRMNAQPLPIGLAYVAGHLDPDRHQVRVLDLMFSDDYLADVESAVKDFQPEAVGISLKEPQQPQLSGYSMGASGHKKRGRQNPGHQQSDNHLRRTCVQHPPQRVLRLSEPGPGCRR